MRPMAATTARDSAWIVVPNAGKDDQGDEWFAFGSACGVVGIAEKGDTQYAGLMFRSGGENGRIFCCMKEGDVGEAGNFSVPLWGLGTPQGAMGGRALAPGLDLGSANWVVEDGGNGVAVLRHRQTPGLGIYFLPKEGKIIYMCPDGVDMALIIAPSLRKGPIECPKEMGLQEIAAGGESLLEEDSEEEAVGAIMEEDEWPALGA